MENHDQGLTRITPLNELPGDDHAMIVISRPGVYILTEHMHAVPGKAGVRIDADNVTLDLGGRTMTGCEGSLDGVTVTTVAANITLRNGDIRGWGQDGVDLSNAVGSTVLNLRLFDNGGYGLLLGSGARVVNCLIDRNRAYGSAA